MAGKLTTLSNPEKKQITGGSTQNELLQKNKLLAKELESIKPEYMPPSSIPTREPFKTVFTINEKTLEDIVASIAGNGFDENQPLILGVFPDGFSLIDGHTRRKASIINNLDLIPVIKVDFPNDQEALDYAIRLQLHRRNLSDYELMSFIKVVDSIKEPGRRKNGSSNSSRRKGRSADITAKIIGKSVNISPKLRISTILKLQSSDKFFRSQRPLFSFDLSCGKNPLSS